ncbi:MAG: hypothetical protein WCK70_10670 [Chloroflexales bacterium]|jgi:hypothetical protein
MSPAAKHVPRWVRILTGLVALLNLAYGLAGYLAPASDTRPSSARRRAGLWRLVTATFVQAR